MLTEARRISGLELPRTAVVPNGVDLECFRPVSADSRALACASLGIPASAFVVLCVAAHLRGKAGGSSSMPWERSTIRGSSLLAASLAPWELDLVAEHRRRCPASPLVLRDGLPMTELARLSAAADVFCLPTYGEGMSNALLEAMAAGKQ